MKSLRMEAPVFPEGFRLPSGPIYEPNGGAGEFSLLALNVFRTCKNGCKYCYVPISTHMKPEEFQGEPLPIKDLLAKLKKQAQNMAGKENPTIEMCFTCDPYQAIDDEAQLTRKALEILKDNNLHWMILSKGGKRAERDFDLYRTGDKFGITMTTLDEAKAKEWEAEAAPPAERVEILKKAHDMGIETWMSLEPVIWPKDTLEIIRQTAPYCDHYKIGSISLYPTLQITDAEKERLKNINWIEFRKQVEALFIELGKSYYLKNSIIKATEKPKEKKPYDWKGWKIHPAADKFPLISGSEFEELKKDIKEHGQLEPIEMLDGQVIDGRNRLKACLELEIEPKKQDWTGIGSVIEYIISKNIHRRHLDESQRAMIAADLQELLKEEGLKNMSLAGEKGLANLPKVNSRDEAAKKMNVSSRSVGDANKVKKNGTPELQKEVRDGKLPVSTAAVVAELPKEEQEELVKSGKVKEAAKAIKAKTAALADPKAENPSLMAEQESEPESPNILGSMIEKVAKAKSLLKEIEANILKTREDNLDKAFTLLLEVKAILKSE